MVVLFLGAILLGLLIAGILHGALSLKNFFSNLKVVGRNKLQSKADSRIGELFEEAENFVAGECILKAIPIYEKILDLSPNHVTALTRLGNSLREEGDPDRALEIHLKAVQLAPNNLDALYSMADDYSVKARQSFTIHQLEMATLEKIETIDRKSPRVFYRMREIHIKSGDWVLAAAIQKKLISRVEGREKKAKEKRILSRYIYNNGMQYFNKGNLDVAILEFKKALREDLRCLSSHVILGNAYMKNGNGRAALKAWRTGYQNTNSPVCLIQMEKFYRKSNQIGEMIKVYKESIKNSKNTALETLSLLLGSLYLEVGNFRETIEVIEKNTDSQKAIIPSLILAEAYKRQKDHNSSQKAVENAACQIKGAILNFKCGECGETLGAWVCSCPACNAFDQIKCQPGINS